MATEKLNVKNFGPIREVELDLKKVTVFIGEQASGKSVLAKLVAMYRRQEILIKENRGKWWHEDFDYFLLSNYVSNATEIEYANKDFIAKFEKSKMVLDYRDSRLKNLTTRIKQLQKKQTVLEKQLSEAFEKENYETASKLESEKSQEAIELIQLKNVLTTSFLQSEYISAERVVLSFIRCRHFDNVYFDDFITKFQDKRKLKKKIQLLLPDALEYYYEEENEEDGTDMIKINNDLSVPIYEASSGIQSLVPLQVILETTNPRHKYCFIVEEPELNLYPSTQKKLVEYLIEKCTKGDNRLIITTHSPYILTALNNLIQAKNVVKKNDDLTDEVSKIVPPQYQLDFDDVAAYFVAKGTAHSILNSENQLIDATALDGISNDIGEDFGKLIELEFQNETI